MRTINYGEEVIRRNTEQVKQRHFYVGYAFGERIREVWSYTTLIGYLSGNKFAEWGYGRYSRTTSKQITQFVNENHLEHIHVNSEKEGLDAVAARA